MICDMCSVGVDVGVLVVYIRSGSGLGTMIRLLDDTMIGDVQHLHHVHHVVYICI